jgi:hypothetical protein
LGADTSYPLNQIFALYHPIGQVVAPDSLEMGAF